MGPKPRRAIERFWEKVEQTPTCWIWHGTKARGYGRFHLGWNSQVLAHRWIYERMIVPIPPGLVIDHLCRNPLCVNPAHLEPVTQGENVLRGTGIMAQNKRKTHCKRGHEFTPENIEKTTRGGRACRECHKAWKRADAKRLRASRNAHGSTL